MTNPKLEKLLKLTKGKAREYTIKICMQSKVCTQPTKGTSSPVLRLAVSLIHWYFAARLHATYCENNIFVTFDTC